MPRAAKKTAAAPAAPAEGLEESARLAADAIVTLLPATSELVPGAPQPAALVDAAEWGGGARASLGNSKDGSVSVLVGADLVAALEESPMGPLELGAAVQPSLDAAATALGTTAGAGESLDAEGVAELLAGASIAVPLVAGDVTAAVLVLTDPAPLPVPEKPAAAPAAVTGTTARPGIELLHGVAMDVTVELGRTRLSVRELLALTPGDVIELDRAAGSPADLLVNGRLIARGEVVVVDENFALRVTEIVSNSAAS